MTSPSGGDQSAETTDFHWQTPPSDTDSQPVAVEQAVSGDTYPIAVTETVSGVTYVALKQAAPDDAVEPWLEELATGVLEEALTEAQAGAAHTRSETTDTEAISWVDTDDATAIEVTVETEPERDPNTADLALGDALMDTIVGATTTELASSATIRLDLKGDAASRVHQYVDKSAEFNTPIEFLTQTVFDTAFSR